jgi:signal transduction histidine kinase
MSTIERTDLTILNEIIRVANSPLDLRERLRYIVELTARKLDKDVCSILLYDKQSESLVLRATRGLNPSSVDRVRLAVGEGITGWVFRQKTPLALADAASDPRYKYFAITGEERFQSMLAVPILYEEAPLGVLTVQTIGPWRYHPEEIAFLQTIAHEVSGVIRNAQFYQEALQKLAALTVLYEVGQALTSTLDLHEVLNLIVKNCTEVSGATGCLLRLLNPETGALEIKASYRHDGGFHGDSLLRFGERLAQRVVRERHPILIEDVTREADYVPSPQGAMTSVLCVPLIAKGETLGTLSLFDKRGETEGTFGPFTGDDLRLLSALADQAAIALDNALTHEREERLSAENQRRLLQISILYDIGKAMQTTLRLDPLLRIILTGVTVGGGLGFNRAALFLVEEQEQVLQGRLGVGPRTIEEAGQIWAQIPPVEDLGRFIAQAAERGEEETPFTQLVRSIRIPIRPDEGILALTVLERRPFHVRSARQDARVNQVLLDLFGADEFATAPLIAKDRVLGVIVVDNLITRRPITAEDLQLLTLFAHRAGMAVENALVYSRLEALNQHLLELQDRLVHTEKMAALGEMAAGIAHEIRNPLVIVGGYARRLAARLSEKAPEEKAPLEIIVHEVTRLEKILQEILAFSRDALPTWSRWDLRDLMEETLGLFATEFAESRITLERRFGEGTLVLEADRTQIKQALINLLNNAAQAIGREGTITLTLARRDAPRPEAVLTIRDTGGGIPAEALSRIFNPFFTTKAGGTGLGLAITHRIIVDHHGGSIEVHNEAGVGAAFTVSLPLGEPSQAAPSAPDSEEAMEEER